MSDDEITGGENPLIKAIDRRLERRLEGFEDRLAKRIDVRFDLLEKRVLAAAGVYEHRVRECERRIANLEAIVHGESMQKLLQFAERASADTEPPPSVPEGG